MIAIALLFLRSLCDCFKSRRRLEAEILVLRHQLNVLRQRAPFRLHLRWADRALFVWLYRHFPRSLDAITIVRPETVVRWHRMGFAAYWRWKCRPLGGRPWIRKEVRDLILFATHSVLKDPPFIRMDLIACRNLLIYLDRKVQQQLCAVLHYAPKPDGYLFLGSAESVDSAPEQFSRALEIGAGTGYFSLNLLRAGVIGHVTSTDISPGMLETLEKNAVTLNLAERVATVATDAEQLPFADALFDLVFGHAVLHHIPKML